jgi:F1F0 ATPase subunit 2
MTVIDLQPLLPAAAAGLALGVIFFGGLLWTVRKVVSSSWPAPWVFASLILRMSVALTGFYLVSDGDWRRLLACVVGFAAARLAVTWLSRPSPEVGNAP